MNRPNHRCRTSRGPGGRSCRRVDAWADPFLDPGTGRDDQAVGRIGIAVGSDGDAAVVGIECDCTFIAMQRRAVLFSQRQLHAHALFRPHEAGAGLEIAPDSSSAILNWGNRLRIWVASQTSCGIEYFFGGRDRIREKVVAVTLGCLRLAGQDEAQPVVVSSVRPVSRSSARQISCDRIASGEYCVPSPMPRRVIRVSPCVEP